MAKNTAATKSVTTARAPRAKKPTAAAAAVVTVLNHTDTLGTVIEDGSDAIDALLAELNADSTVDMISAKPADATDVVLVDEQPTHAEIEAAVGGVEAVEAMMASAEQPGVIAVGAIPTGDASDAPLEVKVEVVAAKKVAAPRKHYTDKVERLKDRVGDKLGEYTVLTMADVGVDAEQLKMRMEETIAIIKGMNKKEQNRAGFLIEFLSGKKAKLNEVLHRVLTVLHQEGAITTGKDGNVLKNLLARPYTAGAARAMGGNTISMFADLKLIIADGKGRFVANPESLLLMNVNAKLFAPGATAAASAEDAEDGPAHDEELAAEEAAEATA